MLRLGRINERAGAGHQSFTGHFGAVSLSGSIFILSGLRVRCMRNINTVASRSSQPLQGRPWPRDDPAHSSSFSLNRPPSSDRHLPPDPLPPPHSACHHHSCSRSCSPEHPTQPSHGPPPAVPRPAKERHDQPCLSSSPSLRSGQAQQRQYCAHRGTPPAALLALHPPSPS